MYSVEKINKKNTNYLLLKGNKSKAKINLNQGGRLEDLNFNNIDVIKEDSLFDYKNSYASSILFPFANRIENGVYNFQSKEYQFICNENGKNALHGLVFNKEFALLEEQVSLDSCVVTLSYKEKEKSKSFPFLFEIYLTYTLSENNLNLSVKIKNTDTNSFPFTLGWHPYFYSNNLKESTLNFKSDKKVEFDKNLITESLSDYKKENIFKIENRQLDDSYVLSNAKVDFITPDYQLEISSTTKENYLQIYTPKGFSLIAIEPMTGVSNSFNNKIGLQILASQQSYSLKWNLNINTFL